MRIILPNNCLYSETQEVTFEKVTVLIGGNGAGKSSILQSIFNKSLVDRNIVSNKKVVCFSSGQNEKYSKFFTEYLSQERRANRGLNLGCCYYDKEWSSILIFLATMTKKGYVRNFLKTKEYIDNSNSEEDISSKLKTTVKIETAYVNRVKDALREEENGNVNAFRISPYHLTLESFIHKIVSDEYDFERPLVNKEISLTHENLFLPDFINSNTFFFSQIITFFTQAADNNYFFDKNKTEIFFKNNLSINDLSDGEYQILFIYALLDLFDSEDTLFLLDEVDSHLHYKNVENLWQAIHKVKGYVLTTTHLLDSIIYTSNKFHNLKIVDSGYINEEEKVQTILKRLSTLSKMESVEFDIGAKLQNIILIDHYNDWKIFLELAKQKGCDVSLISDVQIISKASSYGSLNEDFGKQKIQWVESLMSVRDRETKNIFLICDKDEASISFKPDGVSLNGRKYKDLISTHKKNVDLHFLAWKRREIKNYLLSYTALCKYDLIYCVNNDHIAKTDYLQENKAGDNESIRKLNVKDTVTQIIDTDGVGLDINRLTNYIIEIPPAEISEDIENMFNFIKDKLNV